MPYGKRPKNLPAEIGSAGESFGVPKDYILVQDYTCGGGSDDMNKMDLINSVAEKTEMTKKDAEKVINAVFDSIGEALANGEKVQLVGFGTFEVKERAARTGRNPRTGEEISIPATKVPTFKPGKTLRETVGG
jgi:DNA-binding protein HU-beta